MAPGPCGAEYTKALRGPGAMPLGLALTEGLGVNAADRGSFCKLCHFHTGTERFAKSEGFA